MKTRKVFTPKDIDRLAQREDFGGYGFIGTCEYQPKKVQQKARTAVCRAATQLNLTEEQFFEWLNSRPGRHYFDNADYPKFRPNVMKKQAVDSMFYMLQCLCDGTWYAPVKIS